MRNCKEYFYSRQLYARVPAIIFCFETAWIAFPDPFPMNTSIQEERWLKWSEGCDPSLAIDKMRLPATQYSFFNGRTNRRHRYRRHRWHH